MSQWRVRGEQTLQQIINNNNFVIGIRASISFVAINTHLCIYAHIECTVVEIAYQQQHSIRICNDAHNVRVPVLRQAFPGLVGRVRHLKPVTA